MNIKTQSTSDFLPKPSALWRQTVTALKTLLTAEGRNNVTRAYAEATATQTLVEFAEDNGLRQATNGHGCITRLQGQRCRGSVEDPCPWPWGIPGADHVTEWHKDGKTVLIVSQPYSFSHDTLRETVAFCKEYGLEVVIKGWPAWHFPGSVLHIEYRKRDETLTHPPPPLTIMTFAELLALPKPLPPTHGTTWGPWKLDAKVLTLTYERDGYTYELDLEDLTTSAVMLDWIFQVQQKVWCSADDIKHLLEALDVLIDPQATLCSWGESKKLNATAHLKKLLT